MITVTLITRSRAIQLAGIRNLPYGMRFYLAVGAEWYPSYGNWQYVWAGETGLNAIIGKAKAKEARIAA